ncbi:MAG: Mur ligase family protein [Bdellovibrionota bacterium]
MLDSYFRADCVARLSQVPRSGRIHFIGVGGIAMAQVAIELTRRGYHVSGSDREYFEPTRTLLRAAPITLFSNFESSHLADPPDLVVVGAAASANNAEVKQTAALQLPYTSLPQLLGELFPKEQERCLVVGTFGKSTTAAMVAHVLRSAGADPSYFSGAIGQDGSLGIRVGAGRALVIEGDEYRSAFFAAKPKLATFSAQIAVMNAIEMDHADIYRSFEQLLAVYDELVESLPDDGALICNLDNDCIRRRLEQWRSVCRARIVTVGFCEDADIRGTARRPIGRQQEFQINTSTEQGLTVRLPVAGQMNSENALASAAAALQLGIPLSRSAEFLANFVPLRRRLEVVSETGGLTIVDDFAHHPTAVRRTLRALQECYPEKRIIAVFLPTAPTGKWDLFQAEYADAFHGSCVVVIRRPELNWGDKGHRLLDTKRLCNDLSARGIEATAAADNRGLLTAIEHVRRPGDVIVLLSSGPVDEIKEALTRAS